MANEPFVLDLNPWRHDRLLLDSAALLCTSIAQDTIAREYDLKISHYVTCVAGALALTAKGIAVTDKVLLVDLVGVREDHLSDVSMLLETAADTVEGLNTSSGHDLLALLRCPIDQEIASRYAGSVVS
jgi:hypothetical protein